MLFPDMELFWKRLVYLVTFSINKTLSGNHQGLKYFHRLLWKNNSLLNESSQCLFKRWLICSNIHVELQPTFFDLDISPTFSDKAFKVISIKKKKKSKIWRKTFVKKPVILMEIQAMNKGYEKKISSLPKTGKST